MFSAISQQSQFLLRLLFFLGLHCEFTDTNIIIIYSDLRLKSCLLVLTPFDPHFDPLQNLTALPNQKIM